MTASSRDRSANNWTHLMASQMWVASAMRRTTLKDPASYIPPEKFAVVHKAVLDACDSLDGVKDGVLEDPRRCKFDPKVLQCVGADAPTCLTIPQVAAAVRKVYALVTNPRTGQEIYPGLERGKRTRLEAFLRQLRDVFAVGDDYFKYVVFKNPDWDPRTINFDKDVDSGGQDRQRDDRATRSQPSRNSLRTMENSCYQAGTTRRLRHRTPLITTTAWWRRSVAERNWGSRCPALHGAWNGALHGNRRAEHVRQGAG